MQHCPPQARPPTAAEPLPVGLLGCRRALAQNCCQWGWEQQHVSSTSGSGARETQGQVVSVLHRLCQGRTDRMEQSPRKKHLDVEEPRPPLEPLGYQEWENSDTFPAPPHLCTRVEINHCQELDLEPLVVSHASTEVLRAARNKINTNWNKTTMGL